MNLETNVIHCGDCRDVMQKEIPDNSIDLIYLDPPFFTNKKHEVVWGDEEDIMSFDDRWKGGIHYFIGVMKERLGQCHRVLNETGSMYVHCDYRASHYLKVALDEIFGGPFNNIDNNPGFKNEIIWHYKSGGRSKKTFSRKHDTIFLYTKSKEFTYNPDEIGILRKLCEYCGQEMEKWNHLKKNIDEDGRIYRSVKSGGKEYRYYDDDLIPPTDVWVDISHLQQRDPERRGYPTQKPVKLLERIIKASSNQRDIVLDPYCGCGTTIEAAHKLDREWIGIDNSPKACSVERERMQELEVDVIIKGGPFLMDELKSYSPEEFQEWACLKVNGKSKAKKRSDMGIDGYTSGRVPISVKQSSGVGRNVVDNFETAIRRDKKKKGIIIAYSFTNTAYEEAARVDDLDIKLIEAEKIGSEDIDEGSLFD